MEIGEAIKNGRREGIPVGRRPRESDKRLKHDRVSSSVEKRQFLIAGKSKMMNLLRLELQIGVERIGRIGVENADADFKKESP
jgi:hypothetical protein